MLQNATQGFGVGNGGGLLLIQKISIGFHKKQGTSSVIFQAGLRVMHCLLFTYHPIHLGDISFVKFDPNFM
jgi:hypothetical protein